MMSAKLDLRDRVQVNIAAESGDMGVLANHVPTIEQLKPGVVEVIEESGGSKQFFCMFRKLSHLTWKFRATTSYLYTEAVGTCIVIANLKSCCPQYLVASPLSNQALK